VDFGKREEQRRQMLAALGNAEFGRLLDGVRGIEAGIGKADHLGAGGLRLQQEGREVLARQRMADRADDLAAIGLDEIARLLLQRIAEGIVGGQEEPAVAALLDECAAGADRQRMRVVGPVEAIGRAGFAGEIRGRRTGDDVDLLLFLGDGLDRERHRRGRQLHDRVHLLGVVPLAGDVGGDIGLVLVVGIDDLDRHTQHLAAEILDRHLCGLDRRFAAEIGIDARLVVQDADLDLAVGCTVGKHAVLLASRECQRCNEILSHILSSQRLARLRICSNLASRPPQSDQPSLTITEIAAEARVLYN
jgi:hypothetical protein